jgi:hypothetical protein
VIERSEITVTLREPIRLRIGSLRPHLAERDAAVTNGGDPKRVEWSER